MSDQNCLPIHQVDVEVFHRISENFDLLVALQEKSGDHQSHSGSSSGQPGYPHRI